MLPNLKGLPMKQLRGERWITIKAVLFLILGLLAAGLLILDRPTLRVGVLLAISTWSFCRFYYFAFYVIEHYVDPSYRFSGLASFFRYWIRRERR